MDSPRLVAVLLAGGLVIAVVAGLATPHRLYQEPDHAIRLQIIEDAGGRFLLAQVLWALMLVAPAIGFVGLSRQLGASAGWLASTAAIAIGIGAGAGVLFVVWQTVDPLGFWLNGGGSWASALSAWLTIAAAILYGVAMLQVAGPWAVAGFAVLGYAVIGAGALLLSAPAFFVVVGLYAVALVPARVVLKHVPAV